MKYSSAILLAAAFELTACSNLTDVSAPDLVQPSTLENALGAETLRAGAVAAFAIAYGVTGSSFTGSQVLDSGMMSDELTSTDLGRDDADSRNSPDGSGGWGPYFNLHVARNASLHAIPVLRQFAPQAKVKVAQLFAQVGYAELFFAENLCSGVPLSTFANGSPEYGKPFTTAELYAQALQDLDSAAAQAADSARMLNMIRVGRGRVLLNQGKFAEAAQAVAGVPTSYVFNVEYAASQPNGVVVNINNARAETVSDKEGTNGLDFRSANDPRVRTTLLGTVASSGTRVYGFDKYSSTASPIPLATGIEARLIEAEAALQSGNAGQWLTILNDLRAAAGAGALSPLTDPGSASARVDLQFRERAFWLFLTGHRHGDLRRLVRQYGRGKEQVFPTGSYKGISLYGPDITRNVPATESPNPNWSGKCLNRDA
jgi:starch-binding outer membrane protein, SusD/RagB family